MGLSCFSEAGKCAHVHLPPSTGGEKEQTTAKGHGQQVNASAEALLLQKVIGEAPK